MPNLHGKGKPTLSHRNQNLYGTSLSWRTTQTSQSSNNHDDRLSSLPQNLQPPQNAMKFLSKNLKQPAPKCTRFTVISSKPIPIPIGQRDDICPTPCGHLKWWHDANGCQTYNCECTADYSIRKPPQAKTKRIVL